MNKMIEKDIKFDWDDILIMPSETTGIVSRFSDIKLERVPLFTAPMDTVVDMSNYHLFREKGINVCLPRNAENQHTYSTDSNIFRSMSLKEFSEVYVDRRMKPQHAICVDTANGHIRTLIQEIRNFRQLHGDEPKIMVGNIANPKTLALLDEAGANYCRVGIGNGSGCFLDGVLVKTEKGFFPIEDIRVGDKVLTHLGNYCEVLARTRFISGAKMIKINGHTCTEDHEFLVILKEDQEKINEQNYMKFAFWLEANKIIEEDHLILEMELDD